MKLVQLQRKSLINENMPPLMVYIHKNQCELFHRSSNALQWGHIIDKINYHGPPELLQSIFKLILHLFAYNLKIRFS